MPVRLFYFLFCPCWGAMMGLIHVFVVCVRACLVGGWVVAYEQSLSEGLRTERRLFHMTFATEDQREGTWSFIWSECVIPPSDAGDIRHDGFC